MSRAFHIGVVFALTAHMLCGCCLHHAHAYGEPSDAEALAVEASSACRHASAEVGQSCDHPPQHQQCGTGKCVFTRPDSKGAPDLSIDHGGLNPVCVLLGNATLGGVDRVDSSPGKMGVPVPLHLLNQAILL